MKKIKITSTEALIRFIIQILVSVNMACIAFFNINLFEKLGITDDTLYLAISTFVTLIVSAVNMVKDTHPIIVETISEDEEAESLDE